MVYDSLRHSGSSTSSKAYLRILHLAAQEGESRVEEALRFLIREGKGITPECRGGERNRPKGEKDRPGSGLKTPPFQLELQSGYALLPFQLKHPHTGKNNCR